MATIYRYRAVRLRQTQSSSWLVLFGAPAAEIDAWAGAPQKKKPGAEETTGFQRDIHESRVKSLREFYKDEHNIIQNPLLCATKDNSAKYIRFIADDSPVDSGTGGIPNRTSAQLGFVEVEAENLDALSLVELLRRVKSDLERRVPSLASQKVNPQRILHLKQVASADPATVNTENDGNDEGDEPDSGEPDAAAVVFSDESHILEFWEDIAARVQVLDEAGSTMQLVDNFAGYPKDAMVAFLRPIVIVDGQHRLRGAVDVARESTKSPLLA